MARATLPPVKRQLHRVRRRLFLQTLVNSLAFAWIIALVVAACWITIQPHLFPFATQLMRWGIAGGGLVLSTIAAIIAAFAWRPSPVDAALAFDERFGLKERITTSLTLSDPQAASPAGMALLDDVNTRVAKLAVPDRFPVRVPNSAWLVPLAAVAILLIALFYRPEIALPAASAGEQLVTTPEEKKELENRITKIRKKAEEKQANEKRQSPMLEKLDAEVDQLTRRPHETKEEARDLIKDLSTAEEQIKKREEDLAKRAEALNEQMKQVSRTSKEGKKDGPAKDLAKALDQGNLERVKNELDKLSDQLKAEAEAEKLKKKLEDENLSKEEREKTEKKLEQMKAKQMSKEDRNKLRDQMKDIKDKVERLSRSKEEKEKELRDKAAKGELDKNQLESELERLEKDSGMLSKDDLDNLKSMAQKLNQAGEALQQGSDGEASEMLRETGEGLGSLDREQEQKQLAEKREELEEMKDAMADALGGNPRPAAGRRPESKATVTNSVDTRERGRLGKGQMSIVDTLPGEGLKGPRRPAELTEEIQQASQEAPEAIDRQRLPRSASDMARGYFDKLRGDHDKKPKP
jgi:hypothetical protein